MADKVFINDAVVGYMDRIINTLSEDGGRVMISFDPDKKGDTWMVGMEWGREAPDSDMAGAAAYGLRDTLESALSAALEDSGK